MRASNAIGTLIEACAEEARTLQDERAFVRSEERGALLRSLAAERRLFARELEAIDSPGVERSTHRSALGLARSVNRAVRIATGCRTDGDAMMVCRQSRARTESLYEKALLLLQNGRARDIVNAQHDRLAAERAELAAAQF